MKKPKASAQISAMKITLGPFLFLVLLFGTKARASDASLSDLEKADQAINAGLSSGDTLSVSSWLDERFTWIRPTGEVQTRDQVLAEVAAGGASDAYGERCMRDYGPVAVIAGTRHLNQHTQQLRFLRIYVSSSGGWRAFSFQENLISPKSERQQSVSAETSPRIQRTVERCVNPCTSIPYLPTTSAEQDVVNSFMRLQTAIATLDVDEYANRLADDLVIVKPNFDGTVVAKADAVSSRERARELGMKFNPPEVLEAQVWVFGDVAVMRATNAPVHNSGSDKPYLVQRVWIKRDAQWQLSFSQQTTITN